MLKKIVSLLSFALLSGALLPASAYAQEKPTAPAAEKSDKPAKAEGHDWKNVFPDGLIKAGEKADKAKPDAVKTLKGKFVAVYNSASWCGPCRVFTPELVKFYKKNQKQMEIIFKSADRTEDAMIAYAKKNKMKWLAIPFGKRCTTKAAGGIPHFVVYAPDGTLFAEISGSGEKSMKALNALPEQMKEWQKEHKKR